MWVSVGAAGPGADEDVDPTRKRINSTERLAPSSPFGHSQSGGAAANHLPRWPSDSSAASSPPTNELTKPTSIHKSPPCPPSLLPSCLRQPHYICRHSSGHSRIFSALSRLFWPRLHSDGVIHASFHPERQSTL